jgi:hypothetical protein
LVGEFWKYPKDTKLVGQEPKASKHLNQLA